jgi:hypothetical protein
MGSRSPLLPVEGLEVLAPKGFEGLSALFSQPSRNALLPQTATNGLGLGMVPPNTTNFGLGMVPPAAGTGLGLGMVRPAINTTPISNVFLEAETKRKVYFAFRHRDIMRVNNVRKAWCIAHPNRTTHRSFYDRSIWDRSAAKTDEGLKDLMRRGVEFSSVVCVLVGTDTWWSRWVRYEIARSVVDERGLLSVHINGLNHVSTQQPSPRGYSPLHCLGIYHSPDNRYFLAQKVDDGAGNWELYEDFKGPVSLPRYIPSVPRGYVEPLSDYVPEYDYVAEAGHRNIGAWIDRAALAVGR